MTKIPANPKPREVVCFYPVELPTQEGDVYIFLAKDVASEVLFQTGVEKGNDIDLVLKHIGLLMENKDFNIRKDQPFTLVLHKHEQYQKEIEALIKPHRGTLFFDDLYLTHQMVPVIKYLLDSMAKRAQG